MTEILVPVDDRPLDYSSLRRRVERGRENVFRFLGDRWAAFAAARRAAMVLADLEAETWLRPFVAELGPMRGRIVGSQSVDGLRGWRIDWDEDKGLHCNWWDHRNDPARRDKRRLVRGANIVELGTLDQYYEIVSHFP